MPPVQREAADQPVAAVGSQPLDRKNVLIAVGVYALNVVVAFLWAYDLFGKVFDLIHNKCAAKRDFTVECEVIPPSNSALWGLLIAGGGMTLALVCALVLAAAAAVTRRNAWIWPAIALPIVVIAGAAGHFLVNSAIGG
ncbi:hypothetical protein [Nocardia sp. NPDC050406]|uniref:hypothetical protein n=1 Tax=Nocardia sp. NPDC050406 TaxID=3364318 RepID=UPI0037B948DB